MTPRSFENPDFNREARCGYPEVVFGEGKSDADLTRVSRKIFDEHGRVLVTRVNAERAPLLLEHLPGARYEDRARCVVAESTPIERRGRVMIVSAGTSDVPVAEEARVAAECTGSEAETHYDVGIAGLHRVLAIESRFAECRAIVAVAGMDGALPTVIAGLTDRPVIAVPTSVGYGAAFEGIAPLLTMLNGCAAGIAVVNIDNGFGAGMMATRINLLAEPRDR